MRKTLLLISFILHKYFSQPTCPSSCPDPLTDCTIRVSPDQSQQPIIVTAATGTASVICNQEDSQCEATEIFLASNSFDLLCNRLNGCLRTEISIGTPQIPPLSCSASDFNNPNGLKGSVNCNGGAACQNANIYVGGDYSDGITILGLEENSLNGANIVVDLEEDQPFILRCGISNLNSCDNIKVFCNSCNCRCIGGSCPDNIVRGENCPPRGTFSPRFPEIECTPSIPPPDECRDPPYIKEDMDGSVECKETNDCCSCEEVKCGPDCKDVQCDGFRSCIAVKMNIESIGGARLNCNLDESCSKVLVNGNNMVSVLCNGDFSCTDGEFEITNTADITGLSIKCDGDNSCENVQATANNAQMLSCDGNNGCQNSRFSLQCEPDGCRLSCDGDMSCEKAVLKLGPVSEFGCTGNFACREASITLDCLEEGCDLTCSGTQSCRESMIDIKNVNSIECTDSGACFRANIDAVCTLEKGGCEVMCGDRDSCRQSTQMIKNTAGLMCNNDFACAAAIMRFDNNQGGQLLCKGSSACRDLVVKRLDNIDSIACEAFRSCRDSIIEATCNSDSGCGIMCNGAESCFNTTLTTTNGKGALCLGDRSCARSTMAMNAFDSSFEIMCNDPTSCLLTRFNIEFNDDISTIKSIVCSSTNSCLSTVFELNAMGLDSEVIVEKVTCRGIQACRSTKWILKNVRIQTIECSPASACDFIIDIQCRNSNGGVINNCVDNIIQ